MYSRKRLKKQTRNEGPRGGCQGTGWVCGILQRRLEGESRSEEKIFREKLDQSGTYWGREKTSKRGLKVVGTCCIRVD